MKKPYFTLLILCLAYLFTVGCSEKEAQGIIASANEIDVDLTVLSSTMVYAEVYNIMTNPDDYIGKTIKMNGPYYASYYDETDQYYHYVIIEDAAACCQGGLEFICNGNPVYPDDYPKEQTKIEVVGTLKSYEELGQAYYYLEVDEITILEPV